MELINGKYLSAIIRNERQKQGLSLDQLSSLCNISKSYLSKIENADNYTNDFILNIILKKLNITFILDGDELSKMDALLDKFYHAQVFLLSETQDIYEKLLAMEDAYIHSNLITKYTVYKYAWLASNYQKNLYDIEEKLENELFKLIIPSNQLMQIYLDYKGIHLQNHNLFDQAIKVFNEALAIGIYQNSYSMVCYHLTAILIMQNNFIEAIHYCENALDSFIKEFNYKRQIYAQAYMAVIYSNAKLYSKAESIYQSLLDNPHYNNDPFLIDSIRSNYTWCLCLQHKYQQALSFMFDQGECEEFYFDESYFNIAWCYFKLNDYVNCLKWVDKGLIKSVNPQTSSKLITIKTIIMHNKDTEFIYNHLTQAYKNNKNILSQENKKFYLKLLIETCEKAFKYKEAYNYLKLLTAI